MSNVEKREETFKEITAWNDEVDELDIDTASNLEVICRKGENEFRTFVGSQYRLFTFINIDCFL